METFQLRVTKTETKEWPVAESFELFGHQWVVHTHHIGGGYRVSHRATGYGVPKTFADTKDEAKALGVAYLTEKQDKIDEVIKQVSS